MDWPAIHLSLRLALWTTIALLILGMPLAYWLAFSRFRYKFLIEAVIALPLVLPPTVLGFYVLVGLGPRSPIGSAYESVFDSTLPFTFTGLLVASILYSLPFAVQPFATAFASVDRRLIEASWCLGISRIGTFFRLILPLSIPGVLAGMVLTFAHTLGEFGVVLMVGGNIPEITRTASIAIYDDVQAIDYASAARTSAFLLAVSFISLTLVYSLQRKAMNLWSAARS